MNAFAYITWNINPDLLKIGPLTIRWYGLFFALGFYIGYFIVRWMFRIEHKDEHHLNSLLVAMVLGAVVGARLGHCLFYEPDYYFSHPLQILAIWRGGLASHGAAVGILLAIYLYSRKRPDQPYLWVMDRIVVPTALGGCFIRIGNLFNSEILGLPTTVPWAFIFPNPEDAPNPFSSYQGPRHPVQLYEAIAYLLIYILLLMIYRHWRAQTPRGYLLGVFLTTVFAARFFLEFFKERQADYESNLPISVGQWLSIPFVILGLLLIWRAFRRSGDSIPNHVHKTA